MAARRQMPAVPLKLKKQPERLRAPVLDHEVAVEQDGLDAGHQRVAAVDVRPAALDHAEAGIGEVGHGLAQEVRRRHEVGVEDGEQLAARLRKAGDQGPGFETGAVGAVEVMDVQAPRPLLGDGAGRRSRWSRPSSRRAPGSPGGRPGNRAG